MTDGGSNMVKAFNEEHIDLLVSYEEIDEKCVENKKADPKTMQKRRSGR